MNDNDAASTVFVSYSRVDEDRVHRIVSRLTQAKLDLWMDKLNLAPGDEWEREISNAIPRCDYFLLFLSSTALQKKGFYFREIRLALRIADEIPFGTKFIIPVRLDECDVPTELERWQWFDLFEDGDVSKLLTILCKSLGLRKALIGLMIERGFRPRVIDPLVPMDPESLRCPLCGADGTNLYYEQKGFSSTGEILVAAFCFECGLEDDDYARYYQRLSMFSGEVPTPQYPSL